MRVLIPTVTAGAGHLQAAIAIEEAWRTLRPEDDIRRVDVLDYTSRAYRSIYTSGYLKLLEHAPEVYSMLFNKTDNPARGRELAKVRRNTARIPTARFVRELVDFQPEVLIAPHYLPLQILSGIQTRLRRSKRAFPFTTCVVTDFEAHAFWMEPCVDLYCVAAPETGARLVARGIDPAIVVRTGIPIARKFSEPVNATALRADLGLDHDIPTILVLSGGFGMGPVTEILDEIEKVATPLQLVVVCGRNEPLRQRVAARSSRHRTRVLGFVTNMHELMTISDLIVTKPGGLTSSEALAVGRPLLICNPIPGQEAANSDYLLEKGAAVKVNRTEDIPFKVTQLLGSPKLKQMAASAHAVGKPDAAKQICEETLTAMASGAKARAQATNAEFCYITAEE